VYTVYHVLAVWHTLDRPIEIKRKEHMTHLHLGQPDKSKVAGHMERGQCMKFNETHRLVKTEMYMDHLVNAAIQLQLTPTISTEMEVSCLTGPCNPY
jgi:hypothetical protein